MAGPQNDDLGATLRPTQATELRPGEGPVTPELPGRYAVRGELGRGGMGRVLIAFDEHVGREIAIKELLDPGDANAAAHFLREARVTGQLEHPNIVPVYEVGRSANGNLYYTMRLMRGRTLATALAECRTLGDRLKHLGSFWDLCKCVSFVHSRGIVHRDLKPGNVMVGEYGETVLLDWGLAKVTADAPGPRSPQHLGESHETSGVAVGTPAYMSPEQAMGQSARVDERSDVWGLGSVLYELLTGQPPFEGSTISATLDLVVNSGLARVRTLSPEAPPELAAIAEKALRKDQGERYQSARELEAEIHAFMTGGRVRAHAYTFWELVRRVASQHKASAAAAALTLVAIVAGLVAVSVSRATERRARLESELHLAQAYQERAAKHFEDYDHDLAQAFLARSLLHNPASPLGASYDPKFAADSTEAEELRVESGSMLMQTRLRRVARLERRLQAPDGLWNVAFSGDSKLVAAGSTSRGEVYLWDTADGRRVRTLAVAKGGAITPIALSPDGALLATGGRGHGVALWDPRTGEKVRELDGASSGSLQLAFSPDGTLLAAAHFDHTARIWEASTGRPVAILGEHSDTVEWVAFSPDGRLLATASRDRTVRLWSLPEGLPIGTLSSESGPVLAVEFSPDGKLLATAGEERVVRLLSIPDGRPVKLFPGHRDLILGLALSRDGSLLASAGRDVLRVWDARTGAPLSIIESGGMDPGASFSPDGAFLALAANDRSVRLYRLGRDADYSTLVGHGEPVNDISFSADGRSIVSSSSDRTSKVWDVGTHQAAATLAGHYGAVYRHALSPDGKQLATVSRDRTLRLWDLATATAIKQLDVGDSNLAVAFSPDGKLLATGGGDDLVRLRDPASLEVVANLEGHTASVMRIAFSPDGARLASASKDGTVRLWDVAGRRAVRTIAAHSDWAWGLAWSPDGRLLASSGKDGVAVVWEPATGQALRRLTRHGKWVNDVKFSADGAVLATCGDDWTARLWSVATGRQLLVLHSNSAIDALALSPDGRTLALAFERVVELYPTDLSAVLAVDPRSLSDAIIQ